MIKQIENLPESVSLIPLTRGTFAIVDNGTKPPISDNLTIFGDKVKQKDIFVLAGDLGEGRFAQ